MIKYLGSKRTLVPALGAIAGAVGARTAVDVFSGTTRVAQEFKRRGLHVTAADLATYSEVLARCFIEIDAADVDRAELTEVLLELAALPGTRGYVTRTFCEQARYFQPHNGARIDAVRDHLEAHHRGSPLFPVLLTSLLLAADRVDSTTGLQMAYLKQWSPRSFNELELRVPELLPGPGVSVRGEAADVVPALPRVDLAYVDPPYNQHRYFTNYHVWETLVRWDEPEHYGVACKRIDSRDDVHKSVFNRRRHMPEALRAVVQGVDAEVVVVSYNDEAWIGVDQLTGWLRDAGHDDVQLVAFDRKRYIGAQIGLHNPAGLKVGTVSRLRNVEYLFVAGPRAAVREAVTAASTQPGAVPAPVLAPAD